MVGCIRACRDVSVLKAPTVPAEDPDLVPSSYLGNSQLIVILCQGDMMASAGTCAQVHTYTQIHRIKK